MMEHKSPSFIDRRDAVLMSVLLFVVVLLLVMYEAYNASIIDTQSVVLESPPVVTVDVDLTVFERLKKMSL